MSFPNLYPSGRYGINEKREATKLSETKFIHNRLRTADRRFMNPEYLFYMADYQDQKAVSSGIVFQCKKTKGFQENLQKALENKEHGLENNVTSFFKSLRGHSDYWYARNRELANMIL